MKRVTKTIRVILWALWWVAVFILIWQVPDDPVLKPYPDRTEKAVPTLDKHP